MNIIKNTLTLLLLVISVGIHAQSVGINTSSPDASAALDITSSDKGLLIPRMSSTERQAIATPAIGLMVYDNTATAFYYFNGVGWLELLAGSTSVLSDTDNDTKIQVEETTDEDMIRFDIGGSERFKMVEERIEFSNPANSIYIGLDAGKNDDGDDNRNTYIGLQSGTTNSIGFDNTALGYQTLKSNVDGVNNIAIGNLSLEDNQSGTSNTAVGIEGMNKNISGINNTAIGAYALHENTTASDNIAVGSFSLYDNTIGAKNTALGYSTLEENISGGRNTALGYKALTHNTLGFVNTAVGNRALAYNTEGNGNSAFGYYALATNIKGEFNTAIGYESDVTSDSLTNATAIGYKAKVDSSNTMVLGGTGDHAINVGIGITNPSATLDVVGTVQIVDGSQGAGKLLTSDTLGNASWQELTLISDADNDTKIQVEESTDDDKIRFDLAGTEYMVLEESGGTAALVFTANNENFVVGKNKSNNISGGNNTIIGNFAGNKMTAGNSNIFIGTSSGRNSEGGSFNIFLGENAGNNNITGNFNVALGNSAGKSNLGNKGVFIGYQAGFNETLGERLYIDNSDTSTPLLYGEFDNNLLRINGTLNINNAFSFPTTDGTIKQVLETDGSGTLTWVNKTINTDTDDQTIDVLSLSGSTLELSLSDDGEVTKTLDLSTINNPIGSVQMFMGTSAPTGWLLCDGSTFDPVIYTELSTLLGNNTLPDFSGRSPIGVGNSGTNGSTAHNLKSTGGEEEHILNTDEMPAHTHGVTINYRQGSVLGSGNNYSDLGDPVTTHSTNYTTDSEGGGQSHNNMQPFYTINFIIKAK